MRYLTNPSLAVQGAKQEEATLLRLAGPTHVSTDKGLKNDPTFLNGKGVAPLEAGHIESKMKGEKKTEMAAERDAKVEEQQQQERSLNGEEETVDPKVSFFPALLSLHLLIKRRSRR